MNTKNEDKINKARSFCKEVKELALKYELPFFVITMEQMLFIFPLSSP